MEHFFPRFKDKFDHESLLGDVESVVDKRDDDVGSARTSVSQSTVSGSGKPLPSSSGVLPKFIFLCLPIFAVKFE